MSLKLGIIIATLLFFASLIVGIIAPPVVTALFAEDLAALQRLGAMLKPFEVNTMIFIFLRNTFALLFSFLLSPLLCVVPVISLLVNGWVIGYVSTMVVGEKSIAFVLLGLLPHGIFEIPAFILGQAAAIIMGILVMLAVFSKQKRSLLLPGLKKNARYLLIALALLVPAAIMETYVTPLLLS